MEANYCLQCGHPLELRTIGDATRPACPQCDFVHWGTFSIGVGALIRRDDKYLLIRRAQEPGKGAWTNPGGYCSPEETVDVAVEREVLEETGIVAKAKRIVAIRDQHRQQHNLYVAFEMSYVSGEPKADDFEVDAAGFFSLAEMADMPVAAMTHWLIRVAEDSDNQGLGMDDTEFPYPGRHRLFRV